MARRKSLILPKLPLLCRCGNLPWLLGGMSSVGWGEGVRAGSVPDQQTARLPWGQRHTIWSDVNVSHDGLIDVNNSGFVQTGNPGLCPTVPKHNEINRLAIALGQECRHPDGSRPGERGLLITSAAMVREKKIYAVCSFLRPGNYIIDYITL